MNQKEMHDQILELVKEYCNEFHNQKKDFQAGDRISYAGRVYDAEEMTNLVDSALEFWLTAGRYVNEFEKNFAQYLGVKYCSLVNSGSSANLIAFMALTSLFRRLFNTARFPSSLMLQFRNTTLTLQSWRRLCPQKLRRL